jgi:GNAT superfamily N-acetyltransferase
VRLARTFRKDVRVFGTRDGAGLLTLGRGLAGRLDVSFEVQEGIRGRGLGRKLLQAALQLAEGEPLFAQVAPGNASSLRAVLACGFKPIGAEVGLKKG